MREPLLNATDAPAPVRAGARPKPGGGPRRLGSPTVLEQELARRGHRFCPDADDAHGYVRSQRAGERVLASLTWCLEERLRLQGNRRNSVVERPWPCTCLGYTVTHHRRPRWKPAPRSVTRAKERLHQSTPQ